MGTFQICMGIGPSQFNKESHVSCLLWPMALYTPHVNVILITTDISDHEERANRTRFRLREFSQEK